MTESSKATPQEIYAVLEQQKKLQVMRAKLVGVLDKVNHTINSITVRKVKKYLQNSTFFLSRWKILN